MVRDHGFSELLLTQRKGAGSLTVGKEK